MTIKIGDKILVGGFEATKEWFWKMIKGGSKVTCPICERYSHAVFRKINPIMVRQLARLAQVGPCESKVLQTVAFDAGHTGGHVTMFTILEHWKFMEKVRMEIRGRWKSGCWRITPLGLEFLSGSLSVPEGATCFGGNVISWEAKQVTVADIINDFSWVGQHGGPDQGMMPI